MRYYGVVLIFVLLQGCSFVNRVENKFQNINYADGLSRKELIIWAKKQALSFEDVQLFNLHYGYVEEDEDVQNKFPYYVFVHFDLKRKERSKYEEERELLVIINKKTQEVEYCGIYDPGEGMNWTPKYGPYAVNGSEI